MPAAILFSFDHFLTLTALLFARVLLYLLPIPVCGRDNTHRAQLWQARYHQRTSSSPARLPGVLRLSSIWLASHASTSASTQPTARAPKEMGFGNLPSATRR
jgi:hypothetical protein